MISPLQEISRLERLEKSDKAYLKALEESEGDYSFIKNTLKAIIIDTKRRLKNLREGI